MRSYGLVLCIGSCDFVSDSLAATTLQHAFDQILFFSHFEIFPGVVVRVLFGSKPLAFHLKSLSDAFDVRHGFFPPSHQMYRLVCGGAYFRLQPYALSKIMPV
jgi:hypothetical protein